MTLLHKSSVATFVSSLPLFIFYVYVICGVSHKLFCLAIVSETILHIHFTSVNMMTVLPYKLKGILYTVSRYVCEQTSLSF